MRFFVHRHHEDRHLGHLREDHFDQFDSVDPGHRHIDHHHIGQELAAFRDGHRRAIRFAADLEFAALRDNEFQTLTKGGVINYEQHAFRSWICRGLFRFWGW